MRTHLLRSDDVALCANEVALTRKRFFMTFKDKVKNYIVEKELIDKGERVLCALSGGCDSVALLMILSELTEELDFSLSAAHFNHGIRGAEADRDQEFSQALCKSLGIPFFTALEDIPKMAKEDGEGLEECARKHRYAFLFRIAEEQGCKRIATAHHATDNTETVLFHMIRGSGINGLGGIAPKREDGMIRPLLCASRTELEEFLTARDQKFVTDSTNADTDMTRNFIRHKILPLVSTINPAVDKAVSRLSDSAREDEEYFVCEAQKISDQATLTELMTVPTPILKRYLRLRFEKAKFSGGQLDREALECICRDVKNGEERFRYSVSGDIAVIGDRNGLYFLPDKKNDEAYSVTVDMAGEYKLADRGTVFITDNEADFFRWMKGNTKPTAYTAYAAEGETWKFIIRSAAPGDKYLRGGLHRTVRKELNAVGYPAHKRASLPRFCDDDGIFWIPYLPAGDKLKKAPEKISKQIIYIGYTEN